MINRTLALVGLNHRTAPVEIREKFTLPECLPEGPESIPLTGPVCEVLALTTCNRVEILAVGEGEDPVPHLIRSWAEQVGETEADLHPHMYVHRGLDAVRHILCVASGLDSMILGEPQILGQLKDAYRSAVDQGSTGLILNKLMHKTFTAAKRVRTETGVGEGGVSVGYAAVELARRIFGEMQECTAMLVGAGEMAELAAFNLRNAGARKILVSNRTPARSEELAQRFQGTTLPLEDLPTRLAEADIVIASTGAPHLVVLAEDVKAALKIRRNRPMFLIDIAVPRDVDPAVNDLDNVYLYDIDDLRDVVDVNLAQRKEEAEKAMGIIEEETEGFGRWLTSLDLQPTIVELLRRGEEIGGAELSRTLKRLGPEVDQETRSALEMLVSSMVRKLYHEPVSFLKQGDDAGDAARQAEMVRRVFNLNGVSPSSSNPEEENLSTPDSADTSSPLPKKQED